MLGSHTTGRQYYGGDIVMLLLASVLTYSRYIPFSRYGARCQAAHTEDQRRVDFRILMTLHRTQASSQAWAPTGTHDNVPPLSG